MLITYFDEVKYQPENQPYEWLAGIVVDEGLVRELEEQVGELAKECFGTATLGRDTEFHAAEIFHRKGTSRSGRISRPASRC